MEVPPSKRKYKGYIYQAPGALVTKCQNDKKGKQMRERHSIMQKAPALNFKNIARILMKVAEFSLLTHTSETLHTSTSDIQHVLRECAHDQLFYPSKSRKGFEQMGVPKFKARGSNSLQ